MNYLSSYTNNLSIGLSALCIVHCLATPLLILLVPSLTALQLENEAFHGWLLAGVIPTSLFSLFMGCKQHQNYRVLAMGLCGLMLLVSAIFVEDFANGELLEKIVTVAGACILALVHYVNFRLCRRCDYDSCECQESP